MVAGEICWREVFRESLKQEEIKNEKKIKWEESRIDEEWEKIKEELGEELVTNRNVGEKSRKRGPEDNYPNGKSTKK